MENIKLNQGVVDKIFNDAILFGKVADALNVKPISLPRLLRGNHHKLTQFGVLNVISSHLGVQVNDLLYKKNNNRKKILA